MTRKDLQRLASRKITKTEPLQRTRGKDTYAVIEVFRDTSFLTTSPQDQKKESK
jgi:hypothetical protein